MEGSDAPATHGSGRVGSRCVVGVDGGGTRTRVVLLDPKGGGELGRGEGKASLADAARPEVAAEAIRDAVVPAVRAAGLRIPVAALFAGIAGVGREGTRAAVESALERLDVAERVGVGTDVETAFHDAFGTGPGVLVMAGTGSIAWGRAEDGRTGRVGGWGTILGDEGSGYAVGLEALRRVTRYADGRGPATDLRRRVLECLDLGDPDDLIPWTARATKGEIAALVPVITEAAAAGDAVAGEILVKAVEELEGHLLTLLDTLGPWSRPPGLALGGGLLQPGGPLRSGMERLGRAHRLAILDRPLDPARGAAGKARMLLA